MEIIYVCCTKMLFNKKVQLFQFEFHDFETLAFENILLL